MAVVPSLAARAELLLLGLPKTRGFIAADKQHSVLVTHSTKPIRKFMLTIVIRV